MGSEARALVKEACGQVWNSEDKADKDN